MALSHARLVAFVVMLACAKGDAHEKTPPAKVQNATTEAALASITLTPEAEQRLGIQTTLVERRAVSRTRTLGGEVQVPPGRAISVAAPVAGTVMAPGGGAAPSSGMRVQGGSEVFRLIALPPDRDLLRAEEDVTIAEVHVKTARADAERFEQLYRDRAVTAQEHEREQAKLASAEAELRAAKARRARQRGEATSADAETLTPLVIGAPSDGMIRDVHVAVGQTVAAGAPLFDLVKLDVVWIRVPVYVGDLASIAPGQSARVHALAAGAAETGAISRMARPVAAPPSADASAASADVFFELRNDDRMLRPGQRVGVTLNLVGQSEEGLVLPWSAILHDIHGGTWVYEKTAEHTYARRRVEIRSVAGDQAVLARGPATGTAVVTVGAAELFGTEFGSGK